MLHSNLHSVTVDPVSNVGDAWPEQLVRLEGLTCFSSDFRGGSVLESSGTRKYFSSSKLASPSFGGLCFL